jgi:flavin reductase (DIM6/NTAB) family NADH-FMN oxidoreductase RutF
MNETARAATTQPAIVQQPEKYWDRLFAPGGHAAIVTTIDREGRVNAAAYATCVRIVHKPVQIAFTTSQTGDTARNVQDTSQWSTCLRSSATFWRRCVSSGCRLRAA